VFDVLGVFIGKLKPDARCWKIARQMCSGLDADRLAAQLSDVRPRNFQQAAFFLSFLSTCAPKKFDAVVVRLDWAKLAETIGADWANLQHEAEVLIGVLSVGNSQRGRVAKFIMENAHRIEKFPPRLALISPETAIEHLNAGRKVRLVHYSHVEWDYGAVLVEMLANNRPNLLSTFLAPHEEGIAKSLSGQNASWFAESGPFLNALRKHAPRHLSSILAQVDVVAASKGWTDSLQKAGTARAAVAILVDVANDESGEIGALGQKLRKRFPIASLPKGKPKPRRRGQTRRRRK
jgi:hypothetical protein